MTTTETSQSTSGAIIGTLAKDGTSWSTVPSVVVSSRVWCRSAVFFEIASMFISLVLLNWAAGVPDGQVMAWRVANVLHKVARGLD